MSDSIINLRHREGVGRPLPQDSGEGLWPFPEPRSGVPYAWLTVAEYHNSPLGRLGEGLPTRLPTVVEAFGPLLRAKIYTNNNDSMES